MVYGVTRHAYLIHSLQAVLLRDDLVNVWVQTLCTIFPYVRYSPITRFVYFHVGHCVAVFYLFYLPL